jgi:hypothetical protein
MTVRFHLALTPQVDHNLIMQTMTNGAAMTMDALFAKYEQRVLLSILVGERFVDTKEQKLLRLARMVWDTFPAFFPEVASVVLETESPRAAAWDIGSLMSDVPGAVDICVAARDIAHI